MNSISRLVIAALVLGAAFAAWTWWRQHTRVPVATSVTLPIAPATSAPPPPPPAVIPPRIRFPIDPAVAPARSDLPAPDDADAYLKSVLTDLLGRKSVASFFVLDGLARRFVATINNLATDNAAADLWPVRPTAGRFRTEDSDGGRTISRDNGDRYTPFVRFVEAVDTGRLVGLYLRVYPLLQHAYEEIGEPGKYFNDRVIELIDNLLATPNVARPIKIKRAAVEGAPPGANGSGLYVFEDPQLEALSSGQKILLRVGQENATKLKAKLVDIRQRIVGGGTMRPGN